MTDQQSPQPPVSTEAVSAEAVAGLARQVEQLRRGLGELDGVPDRLDDLARAVTDLAGTVTKAVTNPAPAKPAPTPAPSWLMAPEDPEQLSMGLEALTSWMHRVYLRYSDAAAGLPECWLFHPEVVEELFWLQAAWLHAYQGKAASVTLARDFHDRQRPGVVRRIKLYAGGCSRENHQQRAGSSGARRGPVSVPGVDASASIAAWWATGRDQPAPEPPPDPTRDQHHGGAGARARPGPRPVPQPASPHPVPPYPGPHARNEGRW